jgi:hypothetical protein
MTENSVKQAVAYKANDQKAQSLFSCQNGGTAFFWLELLAQTKSLAQLR